MSDWSVWVVMGLVWVTAGTSGAVAAAVLVS